MTHYTDTVRHDKYLVVICPDGRERHFSTIGAALESPYSQNVPLSALLHLWEHGGAIRHEETGTVVTLRECEVLR